MDNCFPRQAKGNGPKLGRIGNVGRITAAGSPRPATGGLDEDFASPGDRLGFLGFGRRFDELLFRSRHGDFHGISAPVFRRFFWSASHAIKYRHNYFLVKHFFS
jgi:hypothetical protein